MKSTFRETENRLRIFIGDCLWRGLLSCVSSDANFDEIPGLEGRLLDFFADEVQEMKQGGSYCEWLFEKVMIRYDHFIPDEPPRGAA